jgi:recombination protein RecA
VRAGQARGEKAWCAWIDPEATLHAPGVVAAGVDVGRMLVVRPPRAHLTRIAVKVVAVGAFEVVVIDMDPVAGAPSAALPHDPSFGRRSLPPNPPVGQFRTASQKNVETFVRKLALAAEPSGTTVLLLTDASRPRAAPLPVALRLELSRPDPRTLRVRVAKERRGRVGVAKAVPFLPAAHVG